ncbi:MAG: Sua5 family C-terminal domain-containing protein [Flavonifractor plautii]
MKYRHYAPKAPVTVVQGPRRRRPATSRPTWPPETG